MKISWGVGITITIVVFTLAALSFMYFAFHQDVNLVRDDYYEAEVQYNETMEKVKRTEKLEEKIIIESKENNILIQFPKNINASKIKGNIFLYRPSEGNKDFNVAIQIDSSNAQNISTASLLPGLWKIKVEWKSDSTTFVNDKTLMVQ